MVKEEELLKASTEKDFEKLITDIIKNKEIKVLQDALIKLINNEMKISQSKACLNQLIAKFPTFQSPNDVKALTEWILDKCFQTRKSFFEEEIYKLKTNLSKIYFNERKFLQAADILASIKFKDQSLTFIKRVDRFKRFIEIAAYYFEANEPERAGSYVSECGAMLDDDEDIENKKILDDPQINQMKLDYSFNKAQLLNFQRKYLQAAQNYYSCSVQQQQMPVDQVSAEETKFRVNKLLEFAIICAILQPAGPLRASILAKLYNDENVKSLKTYEILQKMYLQKIIQKHEIDGFSKLLKAHQLQQVDQNFTVLDVAIIQHNIIAVSQVYDCISLNSLAKILSIGEEQTEKFLQQMVFEKRIRASIDQLTNYIEFLSEEDQIKNDNENIVEFCQKLEHFLEKSIKQN